MPTETPNERSGLDGPVCVMAGRLRAAPDSQYVAGALTSSSSSSASSPLKNAVFSAVLAIVSLTAALGAGELILRVKNRTMTTYDIEMWRYAKELKARSDDPR